MTIDTVLLDAGGVLVFPNWARVSDALGECGVAADPAALARADFHAKKAFDTGSRFVGTTDQQRSFPYFNTVLAHAGIPGDANTNRALDALHAYHDEWNLWETVPDGVRPALDRLRAMGMRLAVVSNANGTVQRCLERIGLAPYFSAILDSHVEQIEKPDRRIFDLALQRIGATADRAVHVGDIYHVDVVGARNASIRPILLDAAALYGDADCERVSSLDEVVELLTR